MARDQPKNRQMELEASEKELKEGPPVSALRKKRIFVLVFLSYKRDRVLKGAQYKG